MSKKSRRKRPGRHTVHTKDPRYNVPNYPRGEGDLAPTSSNTLIHGRLKSRCKNCGNIFYGSTIEHYQVCPKCRKKSGVPYHGSSPVSESSPERSQVWIDKWEREREEYIKRGKPLSKLEERIARHKASLILGRDFGEDADAYKRRTGLTEYYAWKLDTSGQKSDKSKKSKVKTSKGTSYFPSFEDARAYALKHDLPTDRIIEFEKGWAIQKEVSGAYYDVKKGGWNSGMSKEYEEFKKYIAISPNSKELHLTEKEIAAHPRLSPGEKNLLYQYIRARSGNLPNPKKTEYLTEHEKVAMTTEDGKMITVGVPTNIPPESEIKYFESIFNSVKNESNWKAPTRTVTVDTRTEADLLARSIRHYAGGAEVEDLRDGKFRVSSKGYYHYVGA